jgi:hypothetical protein
MWPGITMSMRTRVVRAWTPGTYAQWSICKVSSAENTNLHHLSQYSETPIYGLSGGQAFCTLNGGFGKQVPEMTVKLSQINNKALNLVHLIK